MLSIGFERIDGIYDWWKSCLINKKTSPKDWFLFLPLKTNTRVRGAP
jgi:hypothetical protein